MPTTDSDQKPPLLSNHKLFLEFGPLLCKSMKEEVIKNYSQGFGKKSTDTLFFLGQLNTSGELMLSLRVVKESLTWSFELLRDRGGSWSL